MSRPLIRMIEREEKGINIKENVKEIALLLSNYLDYFTPERYTYTKHGIMGPVGKLLGAMEGMRFKSKEALLGYIINIHNNTSLTKISPEAEKLLEDALDKLISLRSKVSDRTWLRIIRELDYAVYFNRISIILEKVEKKKQSEGE
ncbi:MAG: hypothetical protein DRJ34_05575 [Thermoprotei archaeon]|nr:MAG: hypothetical protein DRJ34_05575 [Thermoprotei archaeon]